MPKLSVAHARQTITLLHIALRRNEYISSTYKLEVEETRHNLGNRFRYLKESLDTMPKSIRDQVKAIMTNNAQLKPLTKGALRKLKPKVKRRTVKATPVLQKARWKKHQSLLDRGLIKATARMGLYTCGAFCFHGNDERYRFPCSRLNISLHKCAKHMKKTKEMVSTYNPRTWQNARIAPSSILNAGLGVHSCLTFRKLDYVAKFGTSAIVSNAVYQRDYVAKKRKECQYSFRLNKRQIAIGLSKPKIRHDIGSFVNSAYSHPMYKNNTKFVVHGSEVYLVLNVVALPSNREFFVPYKRPL